VNWKLTTRVKLCILIHGDLCVVCCSESKKLGMMSFGVKNLRRRLATTPCQQVHQFPRYFYTFIFLNFIMTFLSVTF